MDLLLVLRAVEALTLLTGGAVSLVAYRGGKRNNSLALILISLAFLTIAVGSFMAGIYFEFLSPRDFEALLQARLLASSAELAGFCIILFSLYSRLS